MWNDINDILPEPNREIEYIDSDGEEHGGIYLCQCKCEWRCSLTGFGMLVGVKKWRYVEDK